MVSISSGRNREVQRGVHAPTAEEDVVGPDHGQRHQLVQVRVLEVADVPQDEVPPRRPVLLALPVAAERVDLLRQSSVLLDEVLHVQVRHLCSVSGRVDFRSTKRVPGVAGSCLFSSGFTISATPRLDLKRLLNREVLLVAVGKKMD